MSSVTFRHYKTSAEWCVSSNNVNVFLFTRLPVAHSCNTHCIVLRSAVVLITFWQVLKILHQSDSTPPPHPSCSAFSLPWKLNSDWADIMEKNVKMNAQLSSWIQQKKGRKAGKWRHPVLNSVRSLQRQSQCQCHFSFCAFERGCHSGHSSGWCADINTTVKQRPWE